MEREGKCSVYRWDEEQERMNAHLHRRMDEPMCYGCRHYHQHYGMRREPCGKVYFEMATGHCSYPRIKTRRPWDICKNYEMRRE